MARPATRIRRALAGALLAGLTGVVPGAGAAAPAAPAASPPRVESFSPTGTVKAPRQASARFSAPMVAFGEARQSAPFAVDCPVPGTGRWVDAREWVYDFGAALPGGVRCRFTPAPGLKALDGRVVDAPQGFSFDTGGPAIQRSLPAEGAEDLDAQQVFILALDAPADAASVREHTSCAIEGVAERIPVDVLEGDERAAVLAQRRALGYAYYSVLWKSGARSVEKAQHDTPERAEEALVVLRCRRALPPASTVRLRWEAGVASTSGIATTAEQALVFRTRPDFTVRTQCERVNARAPCLPLRALQISFSAPVPAALAAGITVRDASGRTYAPTPPDAGALTIESLTVPAPFPENTALTVTLPADLTDDAGRAPANAARFPLQVPLDSYPPLAKFGAAFGILETATGGVLPVTVRNIEPGAAGRALPVGPLDARSLRVTDTAAIGSWLRRVESAMESRGEWTRNEAGESVWRETTGEKSVFDAAEAAQAKAFAVPNPASAQGLAVVGIPLRDPGLYVVEIASPRLGAALLGRPVPRHVATAALVTNLGVHLQWGREASQVWVTTLDTAAPVPGAAVEIADYCTGEVRWRGTTDASGLARVNESLGEPHGYGGCGRWTPAPLIAIARTDRDFSFAVSQWQDGIAPYDFGVHTGGSPQALTAHTVLDRTLLQAGETVSMKHFLRRHTRHGLTLDAPGVPGDGWRAVITHLASEDKAELDLRFGADGVATSTWTLPAGARLGEYAVTLVRNAPGTDPDTDTDPGVDADADAATQLPTARFRVEQFRVPTLRARLEAPAEPQVQVTRVPLTAHVGYLNGGSAGALAVTLRTQTQTLEPAFRGYDDFRFGGADVTEGPEDPDDADAFAWYLSKFGAYRDRGSPASAPVTVQDLTLDDTGSARVDITAPAGAGPRTLVAELEYPDPNGERLATTARVALWPAALVVGIRMDGWAGTRDRLRFAVAALDLHGKPLAGQRVAVQLFKRQYSAYRKRLIGGFYTYETSSRVTAMQARCAGNTDAHGLLHCDLAPGDSGELLLRARATDADGNAAIASTTAWVAGAEDWWFDPGDADRMDVLPEQKEYASTDVARVQVRSPFRHATALVSVLREGVVRSFVTQLDGREPVIEVPLTAADAPNVYVSVLAVRGRVSWWRAALGSAARYLRLPWPVDGALPTAQVDLGKPAYRLGLARIAVDWQPHRLDVDVRPAREVYPVRATAQVDIAVRAADGTPLAPGAEVALAAVDEALLELSSNDTWDLLRAMMGERGLEVWTSTAQMQVVGKRHYGRKAVPHGGGGGRGAGRERFDPLLTWQARVKLDAGGRARVDIPLNDSLSSFRIVAVANAGADRFGTGAATVRTAQDLTVLPGLAPLVREGDRARAVFTVRNTAARALDVTVDAAVSAAGAAGPVPAPSLKLDPHTFTLPPGGAQDIAWTHAAPAGATTLRWEVHARETGAAPPAADPPATGAGPAAPAQDRLVVTQTVLPLWPVRVQQATLAQVDGTLRVPVRTPAEALPGRGGVEVALRARLGDGLEGVRDYMRAYPYTCLEQTVSRAVALRDAALWRAAMDRLPAHMDPDGLLRWFPAETLPGSDTLTSHVLTVAHAAGWSVPDATRTRLLDALKRFVGGEITRDSVLPTTDLALRKVAAIAALARYGEDVAPLLASVRLEPELWPTSGLLDLLDVARHVQAPVPGLPARADLQRLLRARLEVAGTTLRLATARDDALWWLMISGDSNAARAALAVMDAPDWRADAPRLVRGLLERLEHGHWNTTVANAWGVLALEAFSAGFEAEPVTGVTRVEVGTQSRSVEWPAGPAPEPTPPPATAPATAVGAEAAPASDHVSEHASEPAPERRSEPAPTGSASAQSPAPTPSPVPPPAPVVLPWPQGPATLVATHQGTGKPWALVASRAAIARTQPVEAGFRIERTLTPVTQRTPGVWQVGDVVRVTLAVHAQSDAGWVVVDDPIPAGASVLGTGLGRDSALLTQGEKRAGWVHPVYEERRFDAFRAYYGFVPAGAWTVEYTVRLNTAGQFNLPPTRVEAMYAPDVYAELPLPPVHVRAP